MRICLSGIEGNHEFGLPLINGSARSVLTSFFYSGYKFSSDNLWRNILERAEFRLIDSGAFTFRAAALKLTRGKMDVRADLDDYTAKYKTWLRRLIRVGLADYWVELDIGVVAGQPWLLRHREDMIASGLGAGLVKVWHSEDGHTWQDWIDLLDEAAQPGRSRYVAIEGHNPGRPSHDYSRYLAAAWERGVRVHAFKMTSYKDLIRWPFYSVDSTSWLHPVRYGGIMRRTGHGGLYFSTQVRSGGVTVPVPRTAAAKDRYRTLLGSVREWVDLERRVTDVWRSRGVDWDRHEPPHILARRNRSADRSDVAPRGEEPQGADGGDGQPPPEPVEP